MIGVDREMRSQVTLSLAHRATTTRFDGLSEVWRHRRRVQVGGSKVSRPPTIFEFKSSILETARSRRGTADRFQVW